MQSAAYSATDALIQSVIDAAADLKPNEALFLPTECVVARSRTGKLRFGDGNQAPCWRKGDGEHLLAEHLTAMLDRRQTGHFATDYCRSLRSPRALDPVSVENVGRRDFQVVYEPSDAAWDAFHTLTCDYIDWEGRPYGGMDCLCSDGRHLFITGTGEVRVVASQGTDSTGGKD